MDFSDKQQDLFNAMGSMYTAVIFLGVQNAASVQPVVAIERTVFYRERAAGMYSALPYALAQVINFLTLATISSRDDFVLYSYLTKLPRLSCCVSQVLIEIPYIFCQALVYGVIVYAMIGFEWTAAKFFWYLFYMYFTLLYFTFYGMMTVSITPNQQIASIIAAAFYGMWNIFSGFIVPRTVSFEH